MQRRQFSLSVLSGLSAAALTGTPAMAENTEKIELIENENFWTVIPALPNEAPEGKIQVIEFFAYSCSHCFYFSGMFSEWAKSAPEAAYIQRVPVSFRAIVEPHARIYYTLEALDRLDLHEAVFTTFQKERVRLITEAEIHNFFVTHGIDAELGMTTYNSFGIKAKVSRANQIVKAYGVNGTPAVGIGGQYRVVGASMSTLVLAEQLINKMTPST